MYPVTTSVSEMTITRPQNSAFSPALNRPEATWPPRLSSMPPNLMIHFTSWARGRLSRMNMTMKIGSATEKIGPTKLCRFFAKIREPCEQRVADHR